MTGASRAGGPFAVPGAEGKAPRLAGILTGASLARQAGGAATAPAADRAGLAHRPRGGEAGLAQPGFTLPRRRAGGACATLAGIAASEEARKRASLPMPTPSRFIADGLITMLSRHSVADTIGHLADLVAAQGLVVFARIDHCARAAEVGLTIRPTELLIFGEPFAWASLMADEPSIGLNLPMKALAWEDENGEAWLTYYDIFWLAERHRVGRDGTAAVAAIAATMAALALAATST
jgi:uncharacterized protein (DUF302 family)